MAGRANKAPPWDNLENIKIGGKIMSKVIVMDHPLIKHKIGIMRRKHTSTKEFRDLVSEVAMLICYEATRELPLTDIEIETPLVKTIAQEIEGKKLCIVPILRAGLHMADGILNLIPNAKVGHIGLYRNEETLEPVEYFCKLPVDASEREIFVVDPMLATGGSASAAITLLKEKGISKIHFLCLIAAPEGVKRLSEAHPDVDIFIGSLDERLNEHGYILPGLGDAGDRIYGTK
jgi:uracil phosphoribosyltransferase